MSYLALARKWRPKFFSDVAGQDHVVRALLNALESGRVHHAFLFAGTRGVGKTTIARILAKALNCEQNSTGEPCGACAACEGIDEGRFVDLLEVDAASRTKVDQTRELLENVQYTPTAGRCKIYLIDEVHMLSTASFNALLKTLEEPPPHVKFLLATTDPQRLPVTVLSRCLQFNLKRLPTALIQERMSYICEQDKINAEASALNRVARAAAGSMRDGLSLLDQALVFGGGSLQDSDVAEMLGSMDTRHLREIMQALIASDAAALMKQIQQLHEQVPDYGSVLNDFAALLQQIAVVQLAGADALDEDADVALVDELAAQIDAETAQLFYQIAITGRRDIALAPDPRIGFEMTMLRMLAFRQGDLASNSGPVSGGQQQAGSDQSTGGQRGAGPQAAAQGTVAAEESWDGIVSGLSLSGVTLELARNCVIGARTTTELQLHVGATGHYLLTESQEQALVAQLQQHFGGSCRVRFVKCDGEVGSAAEADLQGRDEAQTSAQATIAGDPNVQALIDEFDATIIDGSVSPRDTSRRH
ncbi:MAG: DNA polymerase III subunit gamma/tau [Gammaproteobacteria bacterium]|nr:DNA polymerase III subunit gamma/tau [Gammaproteobacteria bacterium]NND53557.1 DNA polymerase III subunit gamma/tau [Gammaproteobacteria bacterium]